MNETLKGVAHIGAELAAAKADLQLEMERHRKTWRQLEQVTGLLREVRVLLANSSYKISGTAAFLHSIDAALSQQAEPAPAQDELMPCPFCGGKVREPVQHGEGHRIVCHCGVEYSGLVAAPSDLIRCWNRRATRPATAPSNE